MPNFIKKNNLPMFLVFMGMMYLYGVLSPEHYSMGSNDLFVGFKITALLALGCFIWCMNNSIAKVGYSTLTWLSLLILIAIQPLMHHIIYVDELLFPIGALLTSMVVSIIGVNISQSKYLSAIKSVAWILLSAGIFTLIIQLIQLFFPNNTLDFIFTPKDRLYGNIAQPNQAGFIHVLAITSAIYLFYLHHKNKILAGFLPLSVLLLSIGVSFSISRTALILLAFTMIGVVFYRWQSQKLRAGFVVSFMVISAIGYQLGNLLMKLFFESFKGQDGVGRLVQESIGLRPALCDRAFSAIKEEPIMGVGYGNYLNYGLERIERWSWFEHAEHSHNVITQIWSELGLLGVIAITGVVFVLLKQLYLFATFKLTQEKYFICLLLSIFVLYSFSEFPLWYAKYLYMFAFLVALLDNGLEFKNFALNKALAVASVVIVIISFGYARAYDRHLEKYEIVMVAKVNNQQKIDAYQAFPNIFGFTRFKEEMLNMVADEDANDPERLLAVGDRLIRTHGNLDVMRVQARLLMKTGRADEVYKLHRKMCIIEHQGQVLSGVPHNDCAYTLQDVKKIDPEDKMGYAKTLLDFYKQRYGSK